MEQKDEKMVLAFDAKRLFNNFTGLGNYSRSLVRQLQNYYPENEYHLFTPRATRNHETEYFFDESKFTIHTPKFSMPFWRSWGMSSEINRLKPDIYHGLSHEIPLGISKNVKTVVTFHDLIYERFPELYSRWDKMMYSMKYRGSAQRSDYIVAISESTKRDLTELYDVPSEKITVLYQSCHEAFLEENVDEVSNSLLPATVKDYYLYVGSIIERKGLLQIILAYSKLSEPYRKPLVVVGGADKRYLSKVKSMISYHHLEDDVYFLNSIENDELVRLYDGCFCFIYPSVYEGFGIPVIESLFRQKPLITSDLSSLPEAAGPGAILVDPYSPISIARAMIQLHNDAIYQKLSKEGWMYAINNFSPQITTEKVHDFYEKIMEKEEFL